MILVKGMKLNRIPWLQDANKRNQKDVKGGEPSIYQSNSLYGTIFDIDNNDSEPDVPTQVDNNTNRNDTITDRYSIYTIIIN